MEVYGVDTIELRRGDRVCWTRNDATHGLVNSGTAEVSAVKESRVSFLLEAMMSASTWPDPTVGKWSTSPTISSAASSGGSATVSRSRP